MTLDTQTLTMLVEARHECLLQMHALGQRQLESIASGDFTELMKILAGKQRLLMKLQEVERRLEPFRQQSPETRRWDSAHKRELCAQLAGRCEALLKEIVAQERQSEQRLAESRDQAAARLQGAHGALQARGAYASSSLAPTGQLDLSSEGY